MASVVFKLFPKQPPWKILSSFRLHRTCVLYAQQSHSSPNIPSHTCVHPRRWNLGTVSLISRAAITKSPPTHQVEWHRKAEMFCLPVLGEEYPRTQCWKGSTLSGICEVLLSLSPRRRIFQNTVLERVDSLTHLWGSLRPLSSLYLCLQHASPCMYVSPNLSLYTR